MDNSKDFWLGYMVGIFAVLILLVIQWHKEESLCQIEHNVADCSWQRTPFLPVTLEGETND